MWRTISMLRHKCSVQMLALLNIQIFHNDFNTVLLFLMGQCDEDWLLILEWRAKQPTERSTFRHSCRVRMWSFLMMRTKTWRIKSMLQSTWLIGGFRNSKHVEAGGSYMVLIELQFNAVNTHQSPVLRTSPPQNASEVGKPS